MATTHSHPSAAAAVSGLVHTPHSVCYFCNQRNTNGLCLESVRQCGPQCADCGRDRRWRCLSPPPTRTHAFIACVVEPNELEFPQIDEPGKIVDAKKAGIANARAWIERIVTAAEQMGTYNQTEQGTGNVFHICGCSCICHSYCSTRQVDELLSNLLEQLAKKESKKEL